MVTTREGRAYEMIPEGIYQAICLAVYDLGDQETEYMGKKRITPQVLIRWEVDERMKEEGQYKGQRFNISKTYTNILSQNSKLKKDLESWRGVPFTAQEIKGFELDKLVGVNCILWLEHKTVGDRTYVNVTAVKKCPAGTPILVKETDMKETPKWITDKQSKQVIKKEETETPAEENDSEVPF
jgi:hypothetical protein